MQTENIMRIFISGIDESIEHGIKVLNDAFFKTWEYSEAKDATFLVSFTEVKQLTEINIIGQLKEQEVSIVKKFNAENETRVIKYAYLAVYLELLTRETKKVQPWGLLTGMRPTKLVHGMKKRGFTDKDIAAYLKREYVVTDQKLDLLLEIANHQLRVIPDLYEIQNEVSLYIGIPFCPTRCSYCTFAAYPYEPFKKWVEPFLETLLEEVQQVGSYLKAHQISITSIYFGGGTATTLSVEQFKLLADAVYASLAKPENVREITVEAGRPDTIDEAKLALLKQYHIKRISINPQSFNQETLDRIGRHHTTEDVIEKFHLAKNLAFENVNMDIIVGLPGEGIGQLDVTLNTLEKLQPESVTVHMLAYKRKSELSKNRGLYTTANDDELNQMAKMTYDFARQNQYVPYYLYRQKNISANMENIGYSKEGQESIYNILMMEEAQNVLGLGVGASSKYLIGTSVHNPKDIKAYIEGAQLYIDKKLDTLKESLAIGDIHLTSY